MIVDGYNTKQRNILINKCFYQTTIKIMHLFQEKGNNDFANKTIEAIAAYHDIVQHKKRNNFDKDYNAAFETIDSAIRNIANKVFIFIFFIATELNYSKLSKVKPLYLLALILLTTYQKTYY